MCMCLLTSGIIKVFRSQHEFIRSFFLMKWSFIFTKGISSNCNRYFFVIRQWHQQVALWLKPSGPDQQLHHQRARCLSS